MELLNIYALIGFALASYSVIANDSVQTLGTFIASNSEKFKWYYLATAASIILCITLVYGWHTNVGDITYGRLNKIPYIEPQWYHAVAPLILLVLTRAGIPVSTSFLVLSAFASTFVLEKMLVKSVMGYALAAIIAYGAWIGISKFINEKFDVVKNPRAWRVGQWLTTGFLWFIWLSHDMANIAVFLPRKVPIDVLIIACVLLTSLLFYVFYEKMEIWFYRRNKNGFRARLFLCWLLLGIYELGFYHGVYEFYLDGIDNFYSYFRENT